MSPFFNPPVPIPTSSVTVDSAGSGIGGDAGVVHDRLAASNDRLVAVAGNRRDAGLGLGGNVGDDVSVIVDDRLAAKNNELVVDNDRSAARIGNRVDVDDESNARASN